MNEAVREWIEKAEGDFFSALREYRARKHPNYDSACFHAQQCVEKYLKAYLQRETISFAKTHDLVVLLQACLDRQPLWATWEDDMKVLSRFAVQFRYPGESAVKEEARTSVKLMKQYRTALRTALRLKNR